MSTPYNSWKGSRHLNILNSWIYNYYIYEVFLNESINVLDSYLRSKFYVNVQFAQEELQVYYNTVSNEILAVIPYEQKEKITAVEHFADYIVLVSDASTKRSLEDGTIGMVYIDTKADEPIIIATIPILRSASQADREAFAQTSRVKIDRPFWSNSSTRPSASTTQEATSMTATPLISSTTPPQKTQETQIPVPTVDPQLIAKGKALVEKAIDTYCKKNGVPRDQIKSLSSFMDHLLPDIFGHNISVSEEQKIQLEIKNQDTIYPEAFLKALHIMGYVEWTTTECY